MPSPAKKPSVVSDRRQSILGPERVISDTDLNVGVAPLKVQGGVIRNGDFMEEDGVTPQPGSVDMRIRKPLKFINPGPPDPPQKIALEQAPPIPRLTAGRVAVYPVKSMKPGDFFFVAGGGHATAATIRGIASRVEVKITVRTKFSHKGMVGLGGWCV